VCANNLFDLSDGVVIERRTLEWLDRYVKRDPTADTGPQFEWVDQRGQWFSSATYPVTKSAPIVATTDSQGTLPLIPYLGGSGVPFIPYALPAVNAVSLTVPASSATTYLVGAPTLTLTYAGTGSARHVYAQLVDNQTGMVLGSLVTPVPVTLDGETHTITIDLEPVAHTLRPGESVTLQLVSSAGLYETIVPSFGTLTVSSMQVSVPTVDPAAVSSVSERRSTTAVA
jgi:ABC-2 type transport system ATP-binding protein